MDNNSPKMSNSFNTAFNIVVQICATMIFFSCTSLRNNVYSENKLAKELSAYIVDTVYIDFNKKYSSIDTARFIKSYSPLNTYILLAYPLCE